MVTQQLPVSSATAYPIATSMRQDGNQHKHVILGIHLGHDGCAAIVANGTIVADAAEERFNRSKHSGDVPLYSIQFCLKAAGLAINDVDEIAVAGRGPVDPFDELRQIFGQNVKSSKPKKPGRIGTPLYLRQLFFDHVPNIRFVDHHLAHAAGAYYTANDKRKMVIATMDGAGDGASSCIWLGENGRIRPLVKHGTSSSIGWFYSNVTEALGWWHGDGEGKTMALAPYGDAQRCRGQLERFHPKFSNGDLVEEYWCSPFAETMRMGASHYHSDDSLGIVALINKFGREQVAAEAQRVLEEQVMEFVLPWLERENTQVLATSGGVFLNVKLNQRIWMSGKVETHYPYPNPSDAGLAVGAALYVAAEHGGLQLSERSHVYWGPDYENDEIETILKQRGIKYRRSDDVSVAAARFLADDKIIGWFQGRMETGPRALGNRSILANPRKAANKDIVNERVKFRESFRPFCPSILDEAKSDYLVNARDEPFMITSFDCQPSRIDEIPAVVHVDGTLRPQTVKRADNPRYWRLLSEFGRLTGTPVVLNTSMNIRGEPIACSPRDALRTYFDSGLDAMIMGDFILKKPRSI